MRSEPAIPSTVGIAQALAPHPRNREASPLHSAANRLRSVELCAEGTVIGIDREAGSMLVIPVLCRSWQCDRCREIKRWEWQRIIQRGKPERLITLTVDPSRFTDPFQAIEAMSKAWGKLVKRIRRQYGTFEYVRVWELHKSGWPHIHCVCRGTFIAQKWLSETWDALGIGSIVDIRKVASGKAAAGYVAKYLGKSAGEMARMLRRTRLCLKSQDWITEAQELEAKAVPREMAFRQVKAPAWMVLADLASCGVTVTKSHRMSCKYDLDCREASWSSVLANMGTLPLGWLRGTNDLALPSSSTSPQEQLAAVQMELWSGIDPCDTEGRACGSPRFEG